MARICNDGSAPCQLQRRPDPKPDSRLGWHRHSPRRRPDPNADRLPEAWPTQCGHRDGVVLDRQLYFHQNGNMEEKTAVVSLAALAQPMRLRIFRALVGSGPPGMTPGALSAMLDVPASTLSFHLKELTYSGLVTQERESRKLIYRPAIEQMNQLLAYLTAHCCQGTASEIAAVPGCAASSS